MKTFNININIHYTASKEVWDKIGQLYQEMPCWSGFIDNCPRWYGMDGNLIEASVEPSGLQFYAKLPEKEWEDWMSLFKAKATALLGYEVGEPEDGFEFHYDD